MSERMKNIPQGALLLNFAKAPGSVFSQVVVIASSFFILGTPVWLPAAIYFFVKKLSQKRKEQVIIACILMYIFWPKTMNVRKWNLWKHYYNYFKIKLILDDASSFQSLHSPYMVAIAPHGIFPFGSAMTLVGDISENIFDNLRPVTIQAAMHVPFVSTLLRSTGAIMAGKESLKTALKCNQNIMIVPGGMAEMFYAGLGTEVALLENRKNFIKLAMESGATVVPTFVFGNSSTFNLFPFAKYLETISRYLRIAFTPFYGRWFLPFFPNFVPLLYVVGKPITFSATNQPSAQDVDIAHSLFVAGMRQLFYKYRQYYGNGSWSSRELKII
jgi:hypothetical protein